MSPTIEKKLNDLGIFHVWQIAELSPTAAHNIGEEVGLPGRVEALDRPGQGQVATEARSDGSVAQGVAAKRSGSTYIKGWDHGWQIRRVRLARPRAAALSNEDRQ